MATMNISKNDLSGWYVASVTAPYQEGEVYRGWSPCINWCQEHLYHGGHYEPNWNYIGEGVFEFRDEQEYLAFMLKWS